MPSLTALPRYQTAVAWSEHIPGIFTVGYSTIGGTDVLGEQYPQFPFNLPYDDLSEKVLSLSYTRGRSDDLTEVQATTGTLDIVDDDEVYNPHNVSSPIHDQVHPLRPYRVRAVGPRLVPLTTNGWQVDDVVRARTVNGERLEQANLRQSPLAYWRFNEAASGALAYADAGGDPDVLAYPQGVALTDATTMIAGDPGRAKNFLSGSALVVQHGDSVNPRAAMTLIALVNLDTGVAGDRYFFYKHQQWSLRIDTSGRLSFSYFGTDDRVIDVCSIGQITPGVRKLLICSWDGKSVRMWVDGFPVEVTRGLNHAG